MYSVRYLLALVLAMALAAGCAAAQFETFTFEGQVLMKGTKQPVVGATIDIYRTDQKGKYEVKTNGKGMYTRIGMPVKGTFTIIVSGPGISPTFRDQITYLQARQDFEVEAGNGNRPTLEEVSRSGGAPPPGARSEAELKAEAEAIAAAEAERARIAALNASFVERKAQFDLGIQAMVAKDYAGAIPGLSAAIAGMADADPTMFGELVSVAGANLAEAHYQLGVQAFNNKDRAEAEANFKKGAAAIALSLKFDATKPAHLVIQGKTLYLLIDKFNGMGAYTDSIETGAAAYLKAADLEVDKKKRLEYLVGAAEVYRVGYSSEQAIATFKKVLTEDPDNISAIYGIGLTAVASGDNQTAADYLQHFVDKAPGDPRSGEAKTVLQTLAKDYKIKPRPLK